MYPFIHENQIPLKNPWSAGAVIYSLVISNLVLNLFIFLIMLDVRSNFLDLQRPGVSQEIASKDELDLTMEYSPSSSFILYDLPLPNWARGFIMPIEKAIIPKTETLLPGATRKYRNGRHEGVDLFCPYGTPVHASKDGIVLVAGSGYEEIPKSLRDRLLKISGGLFSTPLEILDLLYGRRVVIDHGVVDGRYVLTIYAHLAEIKKNLNPGSFVKQGAVIGSVGNSGTIQSGTHNQAHLHFEIRVNAHFLGEGMNPREAGKVYQAILKETGNGS
jgi:murein DD-endopeptidase MepM/ murein hydrolase activator NlpD